MGNRVDTANLPKIEIDLEQAIILMAAVGSHSMTDIIGILRSDEYAFFYSKFNAVSDETLNFITRKLHLTYNRLLSFVNDNIDILALSPEEIELRAKIRQLEIDLAIAKEKMRTLQNESN